MSDVSVSQRVLRRARELSAALAAAEGGRALGPDGLPVLAWDDPTQQRAGEALRNGGPPDQPRPRRPITDWATAKHESRFQFERYRFILLTPLAAGFAASRDEQYAQAARDYVEEHLSAYGPPDYDDALNLAIRLCQAGQQGWIGTLPHFLASGAYDEPFVERVVEEARRQVEWLRGRLARTANVRLFQANCLLWCGLRLDWLAEAAEWRALAVRMLNDAFRRMIHPDGSNVERDPHYVGVYTAVFGSAVTWARAFPELGLSVEAERVARLFDYAVAGTKPSGFECGLHDSVSAWTGTRPNAAMQRRDEFRRRVGLPQELPPPCRLYADAGQAFLRSGWDADAVYLTFDATREGTAHSHLSRNSVTLHAYGRSLLIDPGFLTYHMGHLGGDELDNVAGPYGKGTRAHNTLNLNGWNQAMVSPEFARHWGATGCDAVVSRYAGGYWPGRYGWWFFEGLGTGLAAVHDRILFWMHDRAAVVIDYLMRWHEPTAPGRHDRPALEANWQFCPGPVAVDAAARRVVTGHDDANVLMLLPLLPAGTAMTLHEGRREPFRGWIGNPDRDHTYLPAPQLSLTADPMPEYAACLVTVLVPFRGREAPRVSAEAAAPADASGQTLRPGRLEIAWGDGSRDAVWWTPALEYALGEVDGLDTDGSLLHVRRDVGGRVIGGAAVDATYCKPFARGEAAGGCLTWSTAEGHDG